jgi:hypothetical protein
MPFGWRPYCVGDRTKTVYGFDNWKGITELAPEDGTEVGSVEKFKGGFCPAKYYEELVRAIEIFDRDRFIPWKPRVRLIKGNVEGTVPTFVRENPGMRFSLIHFDCDMYAPTKVALEISGRFCLVVVSRCLTSIRFPTGLGKQRQWMSFSRTSRQ